MAELGERCSFCLVPWSALLGENISLHSEECSTWIKSNKSKISKKACLRGINCVSTLPNHYRNFCHESLAKHFGKECAIVPVKKKRSPSSLLTSPKAKKVKPDSPLKSSQSKCQTLKSISSFFTVERRTSTSVTTPEKQKSDYPWYQEVQEVENIVCDIDVGNWSVNDFLDEDTIPLNNNNKDCNSDSDIFKSNSSEPSPATSIANFEPFLLRELDEKPNCEVINISDDEESVLSECDDKKETVKCLAIEDFEACKTYSKTPIIKQAFSTKSSPVLLKLNQLNSTKSLKIPDSTSNSKISCKSSKLNEPFVSKKQVSIMSYFGCNSKGTVNQSTLKFVEDKTIPKQNWRVARDEKKRDSLSEVNERSITSTVVNEPSKRQWSCPFYKKIPGTSFAVDAFSYGSVPGVKHYFLSHFHYDHYRGLHKKFQGKILCNSITGKLITLKIGIPFANLQILPMGVWSVVDGVEVKLLDANHCPGSVMFLFCLRNNQRILHTGDFRAHVKMLDNPDLSRRNISDLYLDTTYLDPTYTFPSQEDILRFVVSLAKDNVASNPKTLIICGSYTIGKERLFIAIAEKLNCKVWAAKDKQRIFGCIENQSLERSLTHNPTSARIHVLSMQQINFEALQEHLNKFRDTFSNILAIKPTGWEYRAGSSVSTLGNIRPRTSGAISIYGIPYSEHSSFEELKMFVQFLRPKKIIPTVSVGNPKKRNDMQGILNSWLR